MREDHAYSRETLSALEAVIDDQGLLDPGDPTTGKQRAEPRKPKAAEREEDPGDPEADEPEADEADPDEEGAEGDEEPGDEEPAGSESGPIDSIESLAKEFGAEPDEVLEGIQVDNGFGQTVSLGDALQDWRDTNAQFVARREQLEEEHQTLLRETSEKAEAATTQMVALAKGLTDEMRSEFESVDWDELKRTDPVAWADLREKRARRMALIGQAVAAIDGRSDANAEESTKQLRDIQKKEAAILARKMPAWAKDPALLRTVIDENTSVMRALGYSDADISNVADHRHVIVLHWAAQHLKALKGAKSKSAREKIEKRALRRPTRRQGARGEPREQKVVAQSGLRKRLAKNRDVKSASALIESMLE